MNVPEIAILDSNVLTQLGLKALLQRIVPQAEVRCFHSFKQLVCDCPDAFVHYFIEGQMLVEHNAFFMERRARVIVLVRGLGTLPQASDFHVLDVSQTEPELVRSMLQLMQPAHTRGRNLPPRTPWEEPCGLSPREVEVLVLIARGCINKEIAHRLCISLTTVISHRKSIMQKLGIKNVSGLTIYAVMNGYLDIYEI